MIHLVETFNVEAMSTLHDILGRIECAMTDATRVFASQASRDTWKDG